MLVAVRHQRLLSVSDTQPLPCACAQLSLQKQTVRSVFLKRNLRGQWHRRVFLYANNAIQYYEGNQVQLDRKPLGTITCQSIQDVW